VTESRRFCGIVLAVFTATATTVARAAAAVGLALLRLGLDPSELDIPNGDVAWINRATASVVGEFSIFSTCECGDAVAGAALFGGKPSGITTCTMGSSEEGPAGGSTAPEVVEPERWSFPNSRDHMTAGPVR